MALGFMRRHQKWLKYLLLLVVVAFIAYYGYLFRDVSGAQAGSPAETLAKVGGVPITVGEFQREYLRRRQLYERLYSGRMDAATLRSLGLENQVLQSLVAERLVALEARRLGLIVSDEALARSIQSSPDLQQEGQFVGVEELRRRLDLQSVSIEEFEESHRRQLLADRLESLVTDAVVVTPAEAEQEYRRRNEQIKAEYVRVDADRFRPQIAVTDDEVKSRFESKPDLYRLPEKRVLSYLLVDGEALRARVAVTDGEIEAYYNDHRDDFRQEEQACAAHVLVKVKTTPEAKEGHPDEEARTIAEGALAQIKAGADFAAVAKKVSEDQGSAARGGDLGCFGRGQMVPAFEQAAFSLETGQTSELVKTEYGYHIIRVTSRKEETVPPLSQVKERIRQTLLATRVQDKARESVEAIGAALARSKSLEDAARAQALTVLKSAPLARGEVTDPALSPAAVARAFGLKPGEVDKEGFPVPRGYVFIGLVEVQPPRTPSLEEVKEKVRRDLVEERALEQARALAAEVRARAEKVGLEKAAADVGLVRKETPALVGRGQPLGDLGSSAALDEAAYALPEKTLSDPVPMPGGYALLRVLEKKAFDPVAFEKQKAALMASMREERKSRLFQAYLGQLRQRYRIERNPEAFRRVLSG